MTQAASAMWRGMRSCGLPSKIVRDVPWGMESQIKTDNLSSEIGISFYPWWMTLENNLLN